MFVRRKLRSHYRRKPSAKQVTSGKSCNSYLTPRRKPRWFQQPSPNRRVTICKYSATVVFDCGNDCISRSASPHRDRCRGADIVQVTTAASAPNLSSGMHRIHATDSRQRRAEIRGRRPAGTRTGGATTFAVLQRQARAP
jgi:hypothetical protein